MPGVLNFTLGLATGNFLTNINASRVGLASLTAVGTSLGVALNKTFHEFDEGGRLFDMANKMQTSVSGLDKTEFAITQIGGAASELGPVANAINKALGGMSEAGASTADAFEELHLNMAALRGLPIDQKLLKIGGALKGMPIERASNLAAKIAGRGGAQTLLEIAGSTQDFAEALEDASAHAAIIARNAKAFDNIGDTMNKIGLKGRTFFAGIAEGAAPAIQQVLDKINGGNFEKLGEKLGNALRVATQAFNDGEFFQLLELGIGASFERGGMFLGQLLSDQTFWQGIGQAGTVMFAPLAKAALSFSSLMQDLFSSAFIKIGLDATRAFAETPLGKKLGLEGGEIASFADILKAKRAVSAAGMDRLLGSDQEFAKILTGIGQQGFGNLKNSAGNAWANSAGGALTEEFRALWGQIQSRLEPLRESLKGPGSPNPFGSVYAGGAMKDVNALERIGGSFYGSSGANEQLAVARRNAATNESTLRVMTAIQKRLELGITVMTGMDFRTQ